MVFFTEQDLHTSKNKKQKKKQLFMIFTLLSF